MITIELTAQTTRQFTYVLINGEVLALREFSLERQPVFPGRSTYSATLVVNVERQYPLNHDDLVQFKWDEVWHSCVMHWIHRHGDTVIHLRFSVTGSGPL
jgi:hypothetical protein